MMRSDAEALEGLPAGWRARKAAPAHEAKPLGAGDLPAAGSLQIPRGNPLIVVNDAQRATPTPWLISRLGIDWSRKDIEFAVATGSHQRPGGKELSVIFGPYLERVRNRLILHAPSDAVLRLGMTARGTPVEVNPCLARRAAVICLGSVEPHYFAGWTGGRKSIVPGLSSLETMRRNHFLAMEGGIPGFPARCPVARDLDEALAVCSLHLNEAYGTRLMAFNVVADGEDIYGCHWGSLEETLAVLEGPARRLYGRRSGGAADIVVARVAPPLDRDLYQSLKAFENWKHAVAPGGTLALLSPCRAGIGPPTFVQFLDSPPAIAALRSGTTETYRLGDHKLANYLSYRSSGRRLTVISRGPVGAAGKSLPIVNSLKAFFVWAQTVHGDNNPFVMDVYDAANTYPVDLPLHGSL